MSRTIDERVVKFEFDNAEFERNVKTSMSTLDRLEQSLKLDGAEKGFEKIEEAAARTDLNPIFKATVTVSEGFSAMERIAINVLSSIAIRAEQAGERLVRSLSVDQIMTGYGKYEEKIASVQTLVNSTGKSVDEINDYLATLMRFSDETSYGFTEMASSLGQLASSGGDVEKLIPMIMGIANATAFAGKNSAEFSRAIYNLNQSYGSGALKYMDWKSLELAGVASKQLKESFIETAIELGTLTKEAKAANGEIVTIANFGQTLKENWATTDVMEATFGKFYQYTQKADEMVANGIAATYTEAYRKMVKENNAILQDAYFRAAKAAQEAKTFNEALLATKDAVSSKWMDMFDIIFGDYDQAKKTWSNLAEDLYSIFAEPANGRNDILSKAFKSSYDQIGEVFKTAGVDFQKFTNDFEKYLDANGYDVEQLIIKYGSLGEAIANGADISSFHLNKTTKVGKLFSDFVSKFTNDTDKVTGAVSDAASTLERVQEIFDGIWAGDFGNGETRFKKLTEASIDYATAQGLINKLAAEGHRSGYKLTIEDIAHLTEEERKNLGITEQEAAAISDLAEQMREAGLSSEDLMKKLTRKSGQVLLSETISNVTQSIIGLQEIARTAWSNVFDTDFSEIIYKALEKVEEFTRKVRDSITENEKLLKVFETIFKAIQIAGKGFSLLYEIIRQLIKSGFEILNRIFKDLNLNVDDFADIVSEALDKAVEWLRENEVIFTSVQKVADYVTTAVDQISKWIQKVVDFKKVSSMFDDVTASAEKLFSGDFLTKNTLDKALEGLKKSAEGIANGTVNPFENLGDTINNFLTNTGNSLAKFKDNIGDNLGKTLEKLQIDSEKIEAFRKSIGKMTETLIGLGAGYLALTTFKKFAEAAASLMKPLTAVSDLIGSAKGVFTSISGYINASKASININNILKIAVAVGIIAGAMYALARVGKSGDLWTAIKATGALLAMIAGFTWVLSRLGDSKGLGGEKAKVNLKEVTKLILALGASMLLIAGAMKVMDSVQHGLHAMIGVIILLGAVVAAANLIKRKVNVTSIFDLIGIALAVRILAGSLAALDKVNLRSPGKVIAIIASTLASMVLLSWSAKGLNPGAYKVLLSFVGTLYLLAKVMEKFNAISDVDYVKGLLRMAPVIIALLGLMKLAKGLSKEGASFSAVFLVGVATSVFLMGKAIEQLGNLNSDQILKGGGAALALFAAVGAIGALIGRLANVKGANIKSAIGASIIMVTASASLYVMAGAIMIFKNMDTEGLWKAVGAIGALFLALGSLMWSMGQSGLFVEETQAFQAVQALGKIAIIIGVLAASIAILSGIAMYNPKAFVAAVASMVTVIGSLSLLTGVLSMYKTWKDMAIAIAAVVTILGAIGAALYILTTEIPDANKALSIAKALSDVMIALSEALVLTSVAARISTGLVGAGNAIIIMSAIMAIIMALSGVVAAFEESKLGGSENVDRILDRIVHFMGKIGEALGGLVGGVATGLTDQLITAADNLSKIGNSLKAFATLQFPDDFGDTLTILKDIFVTLGSNAIQIKNVAQLSSEVENLKTFFIGFGGALGAFSRAMDGVDNDKIKAGADAGQMFAALNDSIGGNGFFDRIANAKNWTSFEKNMTSFGSVLVSFSNTLAGFNQFYVEDKLPTIQKLIDIDANMNNGSSLWGWLVGGNDDLGDFGTRVMNFGLGLVGFSNAMAGFNVNSVDKAVKAGEALSALESGLNSSWNLIGWFTGGENGNKSLEDFGGRIKAFAEGLVEGLNAFAKIGQSADAYNGIRKPLASIGDGTPMWTQINANIDKMIEVANKFKDLELAIGTGGGIFGTKSGLESFGTGIKKFGESFNTFVATIPEKMPETETIQTMIDISQLLLGFSQANNEALEQSGGLLSTLGDSVKGAGNFVTGLFSNLANVDISSFSQEGGLLDSIRNIFTNDEILEGLSEDGNTVSTTYLDAMKDAFTNSEPLSNLKKTMSATVEELVNTFVVNDHEGHKRSYEAVFYDIGKNYMKGLLEGIESMVPDIIRRCNEIAEKVSSAIAGAWEVRSPSRVAFGLGRYFTMGLAEGIGSYTQAAIDNAETMAEEVTDAVRYVIQTQADVLEDEFAPYITPVLDTSSIRNGVSNINRLLDESHSYDTALGISAIQSGTLNQNSTGKQLSVNVSFTINEAGGNLTESDFEKFGRQIAMIVNNELGAMI